MVMTWGVVEARSTGRTYPKHLSGQDLLKSKILDFNTGVYYIFCVKKNVPKLRHIKPVASLSKRLEAATAAKSTKGFECICQGNILVSVFNLSF